MSAHVQHALSNTSPAAFTATVAFGSNVKAGNLICGGVYWTSGTILLNTVTDNLGNTYTISTSTVSGSNSITNFYAYNIAGGACTVTLTFDTSMGFGTSVLITVHEASGCKTSAAIDGSQHNIQNNPGTGLNAVTSGADISTTVNGDYMFVFSGSGSSGILTAGTNVSWIAANTGSNLGSEYLIQAAAGAIKGTYTWDVAFGVTGTTILAFKDSATITGLRPAICL